MNEKTYCSIQLHIYKKALKMQNAAIHTMSPLPPVPPSPQSHSFISFFNQNTASVSNKKSITGEINWYTSFSATYRRWNRTFSQHAYNEPVVVQGDFFFFWQTKAEMQEKNHNRSQYHRSDPRSLALSRQKKANEIWKNHSTDDKGPL